jgi:putative DNA methylase
MVDWVRKAVEHLPASVLGVAEQRDARARVHESDGAAISTDPPYYDNISYADLSDFFFVWLRKNLSDVWPDECATLLTPKSTELIANRYRAGSKEAAERHFESGMAEFMAEVASAQPPDVPATIYYAYKATETKEGELRSTGWDTFLQAVLDSGLQVNATWPMRTELGNRLLASKSNALASSIVLVCRPRSSTAALASRGEFVAALRDELPEAVRLLQSGNIAPVDMAQSTIGPGIKVFSRYAKVVEADGSAMSVSSALSIINDVLGDVLDGEEAELDADTRFASTWFAQHGYNPGGSGEADGLARAKNTSLGGIQDAGIGEARAGKFRLYERSELDPDWMPIGDSRLTVWEATQHLVAALERSESEAAALLHQLGGYADRARQLSYVLFQKATDNGWADEAGAYNTLITAWPALQTMTGSDDNQQQLL